MGRKELAFALTWQRNTEPVGTAVTDLLRFLGAKLGRTIIPRVAIAYDELHPMFERGDVDFGWLPPLTFSQLRQKKLARTLLVNQRHGAQAFHAVRALRGSIRTARVATSSRGSISRGAASIRERRSAKSAFSDRTTRPRRPSSK